MPWRGVWNKSTMKPTVSIGIPTYNRAPLLAQAIKSVLQETYQDFEIIVSDDCSSDNTADVVRSFGDDRIRYHRTTGKLKVPPNWNECVRLAQGEFFALLPDDDVYCPEFLETMVAALRQVPDAGFVQCGFQIVDQELRCIRPRLVHPEPLTLRGEDAVIWQLQHLYCLPAALLFRHSAMLQMGLWREDYWDDWAFIVRLAYRHGFVFVPKLLSCVRFHDQNLGKQIVELGFDNILNTYNNNTDVFGEALPATPRIIALRASRDRRLSHMYMIAVVRSLQRFDWAKARLYFAQARHLYALAGIDLGFIGLALANTVEKYRERKRRQTARLKAPVVRLD